MKTIRFAVSGALVILMALLLGVAVAQTDETREAITVKSTQESNGVVIINGQGEKAPIELQCNKDFASCNSLKPGEYMMVRLPKNRGMYECANVTVYARSADPAVRGDQVGQYCISDK